jgi:hypothetical protein
MAALLEMHLLLDEPAEAVAEDTRIEYIESDSTGAVHHSRVLKYGPRSWRTKAASPSGGQ